MVEIRIVYNILYQLRLGHGNIDLVWFFTFFLRPTYDFRGKSRMERSFYAVFFFRQTYVFDDAKKKPSYLH